MLNYIVAAKTPFEAFKYGWWFGFGHFIFGLYWISSALLVESEKFALFIPLALIVIPFLCSVIYVAPACYLTKKFMPNALGLAINWIIFEIIRGYILTGFPWNLLAYSLGNNIELSQVAAIIGSNGLGFIIIYFCASSYYLKQQKFGNFAISSIIVLLSFYYGHTRLEQYPTILSNKEIMLVQANIEQKNIVDRSNIKKNILTHMKLSLGASNIVIWPEAAIDIAIDANVIEFIKSAIPVQGLLITGTIRNDQEKWHNSIVAIDYAGNIIDFYDKMHLVPFGEFIPFRKFIPSSIEKITGGIGDWDRGSSVKQLNIKPYAPSVRALICYEDIFNYEMGEMSGWILSITNDGWFGETAGPYQHFHSARFRAIENGVPLVRAANRGVSAIIDSYGRIVKSLGLHQYGVIKGHIPEKAKTTFFYNYPYFTILLLTIMFIANASYYAFKNRFKTS